MQAYEGYFENGQFHTLVQTTHIKGRRRAIITILDESDESVELAKSENQETKPETEHAKAWREFFEAVNASSEEIPETFERVSLNRKVSL